MLGPPRAWNYGPPPPEAWSAAGLRPQATGRGVLGMPVSRTPSMWVSWLGGAVILALLALVGVAILARNGKGPWANAGLGGSQVTPEWTPAPSEGIQAVPGAPQVGQLGSGSGISGSEDCAAEGTDPFADHDPRSNRYNYFCCPGLTQKLGTWDRGTRRTFRCVKAPPMPDWRNIIGVGKAPPEQARLLTFNTFWQNHQYQMLASLLAHISPDIAALEEIPSWKRRDGLMDSLKRLGTSYKWVPSGGVQVNYDGHLMYRSDRWNVLESGTLLVDQRARSPGILRGVHWAVFERKSDKARLLVFAGHPSYARKKPSFLPLDWPAMDLVQKAAPLMQRLAAQWTSPSVFMCDCNTGDNSASMRWLKSGGGGIHFQTAATSDIDHIYTETAPRPIGMLAQRMVVRPNRVGTRRPEWAMSDHPPVFVDVAITGGGR